MSFDGFSEVEIQKLTTKRIQRPDVKTAKKIPCHTKVSQNIMKSDENQNKAEMVEIPLNDPEPAGREEVVVELKAVQTQQVPVARSLPAVQTESNGHDDKQIRHQDFELHRKLMEEQNKMKRNLLQDAISKHAEKTQAEAKKLGEIKHALEVLDSELSNDVGILRKEIETATLAFNQIEKQYTAIEKNFLKAKQDLYQAHEKKEMLTEHLYTIIQHNEDRKAKRLSELMAKVGLTLDENGS